MYFFSKTCENFHAFNVPGNAHYRTRQPVYTKDIHHVYSMLCLHLCSLSSLSSEDNELFRDVPKLNGERGCSNPLLLLGRGVLKPGVSWGW